jgi:Predicted membrane protein (DUF2243)
MLFLSARWKRGGYPAGPPPNASADTRPPTTSGTGGGSVTACRHVMASSHVAGDSRDGTATQTRRSIWSGVLAGVGLVEFIDETVFHQLLHRHHFYHKSTLAVGLVSDGLFHVGGFIAMVCRAARGEYCRGCCTASPSRSWRRPIASRHTGAELMYYGGTVVEVTLAAVVIAQWYQISGRPLTRTRRRSQSVGPQLPIAPPPGVAARAPLLLSHLGRISRGARAGHKRTPRAQ